MSNIRRVLSLASIGAIALLGIACSSDSPTAPQQQPTPNPGSGADDATWTITITPAEDELAAGAETSDSTLVTVQVRRSDTGGAPPDESTAILSTSVGTLTSAAGAVGGSVPIVLENGFGSAILSVSAAEEGNLILQAQFQGSFGQKVVRLKEQLPDEEEEPIPLFIEEISPREGPPSGGTTVRIFGTGFVEPVRVFFGGIPAIVESVSETRIVVSAPSRDVPVGSIETVDLRVDVGVNTVESGSDTLQSAFTYTRGSGGTPQELRLISLTPTFGPNEGGTEVTIFGEGFEGEVQVFFGTQARIEAPVLQVTSSRIVALTPSATGPNAVNQNAIVDVLVRNTRSGLEDTLPAAFQYGGGGNPGSMFISAISPSQGPIAGGTRVTIFGQGFEEPVAVTAGGFGQQIVSVTGTEVVINTVPIEVSSCNDVSGPVSVTNIETGETTSGPNFTYKVPEPLIFAVSPNRGNTLGGTVVTITGSGFENPVRVVFETVPEGENTQPVRATASGSLASADGTVVTTTTPPINQSGLGRVPCDDNGDGHIGFRFQATTSDVEVTNLATGCTDTFENAFLFDPIDTTCFEDVDPNPDDGGDGGGDGGGGGGGG